MKLNDKTISTRRPADLDAQLIATTGCNAAEVARQLGENPLAGNVARALMPFLPEKDRPPLAELARVIKESGPATVAAGVIELLGADAPAPAALPGASA